MFEPLKDYPMYGISREGEVVNFKTGHIKKHTIDHKGYPRVSLYVNNKQHYRLLHRLLAQTFLPNPDELPQVNHKDGNPANFELDNLEWCTASHNVQDGFNRGRKSWNKDMKSTANMTLEDLARELPRLQELAKALWGEKLPDAGKDYYYDGPDTEWEWHLQQMVIAEDPVKYLEEHM